MAWSWIFSCLVSLVLKMHYEVISNMGYKRYLNHLSTHILNRTYFRVVVTNNKQGVRFGNNCSSCEEATFFIRVRGLPERRMQVPVCGTGRGLDNDAGFVVLVLVPSPWPHPGPAVKKISL